MLLSRSNPKLQKCTEYGYLSSGLMLSPSTSSHIIDLCRFKTPGCDAGCLNTAGMGGIPKHKEGLFLNEVQQARYMRTQYFKFARKEFIKDLKREIYNHVKYSEKKGLVPVVRLNTLSDILWEKVAPSIFTTFPDVQMYDYTKFPAKYRRNLPNNYHLTFSRAETETNQLEAYNWLSAGRPISVVFDTKKGAALPIEFMGHKVVDADLHDLTFLHAKKGLILGLRAKGKAKKDTSGFVVNTEGLI